MSEINIYRLVEENKNGKNNYIWVAEYVDEPAIKITVKGSTAEEAREKLNKILDNARIINEGK